MVHQPSFIYILTNDRHTTLYTGVTSQLKQRIWQHKHKTVKGFTEKYNLDKLVYFENCDNIQQTIFREKQLKSGNRKQKIRLIDKQNPDWKDLYDNLD